MINQKNIDVNKRRIVLVFFGLLISFIKNNNYTQSGGKHESLNSCDNITPLKTKNKRFEGMFKILYIIKYLWNCQGYLDIFKLKTFSNIFKNLTIKDLLTSLLPNIFYLLRFFGIIVLTLFLLVFAIFAALFDFRLSQINERKLINFLLTIWKIFTLSWIVNAIMMAIYIYNYRILKKENKSTTFLNNVIGYGGLDEFIEEGFSNNFLMVLMTFIYAFYYNIVGLSTVGFGDIHPKGFLPRVILIYYALFLITGMSAGFYNISEDT